MKHGKTISLLRELISIESFSGKEDKTAETIITWLKEEGIPTQRNFNNVWTTNKYFNPKKPTILLNSHHDTVKPNKNYTRDPFDASQENGILYGLGSNDAGGCLVSLLTIFSQLYSRKDMKYNLIMAATGEEENSGKQGIESLLPLLPTIDFAIVGEPTEMQMATAEKGLLVIDGIAEGIAGHAAHSNTKNAIYEAMNDISWIKNFAFPKTSKKLGEVKISVTQIEAGSQHNVIPGSCHFVIDARINDCYSNEEVFNIINENTKSTLTARSFRLNSSCISESHPIVIAGQKLGLTTYGSPTLSDQALLTCPSLKMGPGKSTRSHQADEYIRINEIETGIELYLNTLNQLL